NSEFHSESSEEALRKLTRPEGADLIQRNRAFHRRLVDCVSVDYRDPTGATPGAEARVRDFGDRSCNDLLAVNQFAVVATKHALPPDVVLFVNGHPLAILELKNTANEDATIWSAYQQIQTYKADIPSPFA